MSKTPVIIFVLFSGLLLGSCGDAAEPDGNEPSQLDAFWSEDAPSGAREVLDIRSTAGEGAEIVVRGRIQHFVKGRSVIKLTDSSLDSCREMDHACPTPWDYCCVEAEEIARHTIGVEFHDDGGSPLRESLKGFKGLEYLQTVTVTGTVNKDDAGNVTVVATALHRK